MDNKSIKKIIKISKRSKVFEIVHSGNGYHIEDVDYWAEEMRASLIKLINEVRELEELNNRLQREREVYKEIKIKNQISKNFNLGGSMERKSHHLVKRIAKLETEVDHLKTRIKEIEKKLRR